MRTIIKSLDSKNESAVHFILLLGILVLFLVLFISPELLLRVDMTCLFRRVTKMNCPFCGMTRDFISIAEGHLPKFNLLSPIIFIFIFFLYPAIVIISFFKHQPIRLNYSLTHKIFFLTMIIMLFINNLKR